LTITRNSTTRSRQAQLELRITQDEEHLPEDARGLGPLMKRWGLSASPQECMWVIVYDSMLAVRTVMEVARGAHITVDLHLPTMLSAVLTAGCERFMLVHNHPNGTVTPTVADFQLTLDVMEAANACGLYFEDHIIVSPSGKTYSFVDSGFLKPAPYIKEGRNAAAPAR